MPLSGNNHGVEYVTANHLPRTATGTRQAKCQGQLVAWYEELASESIREPLPVVIAAWHGDHD
jgi:hypothetical protein